VKGLIINNLLTEVLKPEEEFMCPNSAHWKGWYVTKCIF